VGEAMKAMEGDEAMERQHKTWMEAMDGGDVAPSGEAMERRNRRCAGDGEVMER
jgi:hypothetical protein